MIALATLPRPLHTETGVLPAWAELAPWLLVLALALVSLGVTLVVRSRERSQLAQRVVAEPPRRRGRLLIAALLVLALAWRLSTVGHEGWPWFEIAAALVALLTLALAPAETDRVLAERGVRIGYHVRRFAVLEEWRLTGEHLRVRLFGEWTALMVPPAQHGELRKTLLAEAPERESRFKG